jgi:hypothetical protein
LEEHFEQWRLVLKRFKEEGLKLCLKKYFFGLWEMEYLGYSVPTGKMSISIKKVEADAERPVPMTQKEVRNFLQFCNFYAKFVHYFSDLTAPLTDLLRKFQPHKATLTHACLEAFETLMLRLISAPYLMFPEVNLDAMLTVLFTDASTMGIATIIVQTKEEDSNMYLNRRVS